MYNLCLYFAQVFTAYKYRLYPNKVQVAALSNHFGAVRWVYNHALEIKKTAWETESKNISRYDLNKELPKLKVSSATWLKEVNSQSLQSALVNLDMAYTRFFKLKKGFPKFKHKHGKQSFQVPQKGAVGADFVKIPKVGKIKAVVDRPVIGTIKTVTISKTPTGKYFASVLCDDGKELPNRLPITEVGTLGIDLGLKHYAVLSDGTKVENPRHLKQKLKKLGKAQRVLSRRKKGSNNRNKARLKASTINEKVANTRQDFIHKLTTKLVRESQTDTFAIEDLAVSNMVKNRHLSRSISDVGWAEFRRQLEYKAERAGKNIIVIGRYAPSSKTCSCGLLNKNLKLSDRVWSCQCGLTHDRDILAANNIKKFALHPQNKISVPKAIGEFTLEEIGQ